MPRISILMPVYNGAEYLHRSIGSVVNQTFDDWQLVVLDDGSTDNSNAILKFFAQKDERICMLSKSNDGKGYVAANLLFMYPHATGEFFFYMSQDDELSADCLEELISRADDTGADIVIPDMLLKYANGTCGTWPCSFPPGNSHSAVLDGRSAFLLATDFSINGFALMRSALMTDERCDTRWFNSDEYNTRLQYLWADKVAFSHGTFYYYLGNQNAVTSTFSAKRFEALRTIMMLEETFNDVFTEKEKRLTMKRESFKTYVAMLILYCNNIGSMTKTERQTIVEHLQAYESTTSFKGYRRTLFPTLSLHEQVFAICIFALRSRKTACFVYRIWHGMKLLMRKALRHRKNAEIQTMALCRPNNGTLPTKQWHFADQTMALCKTDNDRTNDNA